MGLQEANGGENPVNFRTEELALEAGERIARETLGMLSKHPDLVDALVAQAIADRERKSVMERVRKDRAEGRMNDQRSINAGVRVLITRESMSALQANFQSPDVYPHARYVESAVAVDDEGTTFLIDLPNGSFASGMGVMHIYGQTDLKDRYASQEDHYFSLPYSDIVRIEGYSGELWQNWRLNPDGTLREIGRSAVAQHQAETPEDRLSQPVTTADIVDAEGEE